MSTIPYLHPGGSPGPSYRIDVTSAAANWTALSPLPNFGFVLKGSYENNALHGKASQACMTALSSEQLVIYR